MAGPVESFDDSSVQLSRLTPAQAGQYREVMLQAYADEVDVFQATVREREPLPLEWWESRIADGRDPRQLVLGAYVDGRLVGVAGLRFQRRQRTRHKASLFGLYVLPPFQGRGIGRRLVEAVLEQARSTQGTQVVQLKVTGSNTSALRLYESCGFVLFGTEPLAVKVGERFVSMVHMWRRV